MERTATRQGTPGTGPAAQPCGGGDRGQCLAGRKILLTGHTGFKGGWLALWLRRLGAEVRGIALPPEPGKSFCQSCAVTTLIDSRIADITDASALAQATKGFDADLIVHLAAQALVRASYDDPVGTMATNVMGTVQVLAVARKMPNLRGVIVVTSDKCYDNREWLWGYRETDPMGGADPYSASKGCAELVAQSWARSFFAVPDGPRLVTVRAGNVFGGGDWARDRLIPDIIRATFAGAETPIRNPGSIRPWQHVLEPLSGYLMLADALLADPDSVAGSWNFGPSADDTVDVMTLAHLLAQDWPDGPRYRIAHDSTGLPEAGLLRLDCSKARVRLGWRPRLSLAAALRLTADWYRADAAGHDMRRFTEDQITAYCAATADLPASAQPTSPLHVTQSQ